MRISKFILDNWVPTGQEIGAEIKYHIREDDIERSILLVGDSAISVSGDNSAIIEDLQLFLETILEEGEGARMISLHVGGEIVDRFDM